jgi:hypothetical protein
MAKPKLALIPSTVGGSVYSVLPSNGDGDFDFSRASAATRINAQGLIETVAVGDNRLNYPLLDGTVQTCPHLLLEPQRTNFITYSESFSNAAWTKTGASITSNAVISPDGTLNADKFIVSNGSTISNALAFQSITKATTSKTYTMSVFAKIGEYDEIILYTRDNATSANRAEVKFSLVNGSIVSSATSNGTFSNAIADNGYKLSNDWYKFSLTFTTGTESTIQHRVIVSNSTTGTGDGTSGIYIYGAQLEEGSYPTSYIPTSGSATTRIAEVCDGSGNASTFNDSEGVLMVQISALANDLTYRFIAISDGTNNNRVNIYFSNTLNSIGVIARTSTEILISSINTSSNIIENNKIAIKYKSGDSSFWLNGIEVATSTSTATISGLNQLRFENGDGGSDFYGKTKQIQYFDSALTDSELETLTSWMSFSDMAIDLNYTIQ